MKKKSIFIAIGGLVLVLFSINCKTVEKTPPPSPPTVTQELKIRLVPWTNQIPEITDTDPINFYNEFEIKVGAISPDYRYILKDGYGERVNNSMRAGFTVPAKTKGLLLKGGITRERTYISYKICFFEDNDTYFVFRQTLINGSFHLEKEASIFIDGIPYKITLPTGYEKNRLLWDTRDSDNQQFIENVATGRSVTGEKEIQINKK